MYSLLKIQLSMQKGAAPGRSPPVSCDISRYPQPPAGCQRFGLKYHAWTNYTQAEKSGVNRRFSAPHRHGNVATSRARRPSPAAAAEPNTQFMDLLAYWFIIPRFWHRVNACYLNRIRVVSAGRHRGQPGVWSRHSSINKPTIQE